MWIDLKKLEKIWDYSIALMDEVMEDIKRLSQITSFEIAHNWLDDINKKIDKAREYWVNVNKIDREVLDFRFIVFKRAIDSKVSSVENNSTNFNLDISNLESEYQELLKEDEIEKSDLDYLMQSLKKWIIKPEINSMLNHYIEWWWNGIYTLDQIIDKVQEAKVLWVNIDDIEEKIFDI